MACPAMTDPTEHSPPAASWQEAMKRAVRDPEELGRLLQLSPSWVEAARSGAAEFPLFVPREYLARMRPGDPADPLLRQVLPLAEELHDTPGFHADPVGDGPASLTPGLLQKYHGRALIVTTGACAVHCRYCFRRHFPYEQSAITPEIERRIVDRVAADLSIEEILLSGGDPLTWTDRRLAALAATLAGIPHVRRLRLHTRLPIVIPQRVTDELIEWLRGTRLTPLVVVHANHPAELDQHVAAALGRLVDGGVPVLNQAVLLRGINDDVEVQAELCRRLVDLRVLPYYLHQLDRVRGAAHFEVPVEQGRKIVEALRQRLPGYAVPRFVHEVPGEGSKSILA
jgi:L-lysine 2,3-aminomutase